MAEIDWRHLALYTLAFYIPLAPFAYKFARDERNGRIAAIARAGLLYVFVFLWIAGGSFILYGIGIVFERPTESCGIGCIEPGSGHWESPNPAILILGLVSILTAWWLGRAVEGIYERLNSRAALDPKRIAEGQKEIERLFKQMSEPLKIQELTPLPYVPPEGQKKKVDEVRADATKEK